MPYIIEAEENRRLAIEAVKSIAGLKPLMSVEIRPYKRNRSLRQNRLLWKWLGYIVPRRL